MTSSNSFACWTKYWEEKEEYSQNATWCISSPPSGDRNHTKLGESVPLFPSYLATSEPKQCDSTIEVCEAKHHLANDSHAHTVQKPSLMTPCTSRSCITKRIYSYPALNRLESASSLPIQYHQVEYGLSFPKFREDNHVAKLKSSETELREPLSDNLLRKVSSEILASPSHSMHTILKDEYRTTTKKVAPPNNGKILLQKSISLSNYKKKNTSKGDITPKRKRGRPKGGVKLGMPKRPLSAYNMFFKDARKHILNISHDLSQTSEQGSLRKVSFENLAKTVGKKWRDIDDSSLINYNEMARREKDRYREELNKYHENKMHE